MITEKLSLALSIKLFNEGVECIKLKLKGHQHHKAYAEAIEAYLVGYSDKYSKLKPLLHGGNQLHFCDFYYPLTIKKSNNSGIRVSSVEHLFDEPIENCITVVGDAGGGKSTFIKSLFMDVVRKKKGVPLLIELRKLVNYTSIDDYIFDIIFPDKKLSELITQAWKKGEFVFFMDGFDELQNSSKAELLDHFVDRYPQNKFILTTRPSAGAKYLNRFENYDLLTLSKTDVPNFALQQLKYMDDGKEMKAGLLKSLETGLQNDHIKTFLVNPLLLSIYMLTYANDPNVPDKKSLFYRKVLESLYSKHDSDTKIGFIRERKSELNQGELEKILVNFSFRTYFQGLYTWAKHDFEDEINTTKNQINLNFDGTALIEDLTVSVPIWTEDEEQYDFSHRSFQEYYACLYVKESHNTKKEIYEKLLSQTLTGRKTERNNLLSLLEEMDEEPFIEYFKLPLFMHVKSMLNDDADSFIRQHILSVYFLGTPKQIVQEYQPLIDIIMEQSLDNNRLLGRLIGLAIGFEMGKNIAMGIEMGIEMGREMAMEMGREIGMGMEMGMEMGREIGMEMGREMAMGRGMAMGMAMAMGRGRGMGMGMGMAMINDVIKNAKDNIKQPIKDQILQWLENKMGSPLEKTDQANLVEKRIPIYRASGVYPNFLSLFTDGPREKLPYVSGGKYKNLFGEITIYNKNKVPPFLQQQIKSIIPMSDIHDDVISVWAKQIEENYAEYKTYIDSNIVQLKQDVLRFNENNRAALAQL